MRFIVPVYIIHRTPGNNSRLLWEASDFCNTLMGEYGIPSTSLVCYWAMSDEEKVSRMSRWNEVGLWVMPESELIEAAGVKKGGKIDFWDRGLIFRSAEEQEKLAITALDKFEKCFGHAPKVAGSFHLSPRLVNLFESYGVKIVLSFCWEQRFGGLVNVGCPWFPFYPSENNSLCPGKKRDIIAFPYLSRDPVWGYLLDPVSFSPAAEDLFERRPSHRDPMATPDDMSYPNAMFESYTKQSAYNPYSLFTIANETQFFDMGYKPNAGVLRKLLRTQMAHLVEKSKSEDIKFSSLGWFGSWFHENVKEPDYLLVFKDLLGDEGVFVWYFNGRYRILIHLDSLSVYDFRNYAQSFQYAPVYPPILDYRETRYLRSDVKVQTHEVSGRTIKIGREGIIRFEKDCASIEFDGSWEPIGCKIVGADPDGQALKIDAGITSAFMEGAKLKNGKLEGSLKIRC
jgi:hypothetical protein